MKLSYGQIWAVLFVFRLFSFYSSSAAYSPAQITGSAFSLLLQAAAVILFAAVSEKNDIAAQTCGRSGIIFSLCFIISGIMTFSRLSGISGVRRYFPSGRAAVVVFAGIAALYCGKYGMRAAGRAAAVTAGMLLFFSVLLVITCAGQAGADYVCSAGNEKSIPGYMTDDLAGSAEFPAALILSLFAGKDRKKGPGIFFASGFVYTLIISFTGAALLGRVSEISEYPFFEMCSFSDPVRVHRSDAFFTGLYTLSAVICLSVCVGASAEFLRKYIRFPAFVSLAVMMTAGTLVRFSSSAVLFIYAFITVMVYICLVFKCRIQKRKEPGV